MLPIIATRAIVIGNAGFIFLINFLSDRIFPSRSISMYYTNPYSLWLVDVSVEVRYDIFFGAID